MTQIPIDVGLGHPVFEKNSLALWDTEDDSCASFFFEDTFGLFNVCKIFKMVDSSLCVLKASLNISHGKI